MKGDQVSDVEQGGQKEGCGKGRLHRDASSPVSAWPCDPSGKTEASEEQHCPGTRTGLGPAQNPGFQPPSPSPRPLASVLTLAVPLTGVSQAASQCCHLERG